MSLVEATRAPNVYTVSPGRPFLAALAQAILAGDLPVTGGVPPSPFDLPAWTILMPTRRAARTLQDAFLDAAGADAMLLPAIRPIAEGQEDLGLIENAIAPVAPGGNELGIPPAIGALERTLLLTELVLLWSRTMRAPPPGVDTDLAAMLPVAGATTPAQAVRLASELARLIDMIETENVALDALAGLVPAEYAEHWQQTLDFLRIATEMWPAYLAEQNLISPADRRNRLIRAEARRLATTQSPHPVIVAGVTGSVPATTELIQAVAHLPNGAIVLPGLDLDLEEERFSQLADEHPEHPHHGLARLLQRLGVARAGVRELPGAPLPPDRRARNVIASEMMRPTGSMTGWRKLMMTGDRDALRHGLADVHLIEAPTAEDEAEVVSLVLREALETPGRTAALVSPDRMLARRVATRLESWGIRVDDSAGRPFAKTVPGTFLDLVANALKSAFAPAELMALLKHPLTRLGLPAGDVRRRARNLELAALRTTYLGRGLASLEDAVDRARAETASGTRRHRSVTRLKHESWDEIHDLVVRLRSAFEPLAILGEDASAHPLAAIVTAHVAVSEAIAKPPPVGEASPDDASRDATAGEAQDASPLWARDEGAAASLLLAKLMHGPTTQPSLRLADYPDFFRALVGSESIRTSVPRHPRLFIWGPYEARLHQPDVVVLGSLNEGVWPKVADPGPWLNRSMRAALGLPSPEEETGRSAHDIVTLLGAQTVYLTRANKVAGEPMVPSRWLLRLNALLAGLGLEAALAPTASKPWAAWARARDLPAELKAVPQPAPTPPVATRPRRASVSDVEAWLANPYAIFAKRILVLEALPPLGQEPGPSERGQIVHETLARFTRRYANELPPDVVHAFMDIADDVIGALGREPRVRAFWRPRLERFAHWFAETEAGRREPDSRRLVEIDGQLVFDAPGGSFKLTARADRIDLAASGIAITDYKTGGPPKAAKVIAGEAPQLPLEAAMVAAGVFPQVTTSIVTALRYIRASGGEPPGDECLVIPKGESIADFAARTLTEFQRLVARFDHPATPYKALRRKRFDYRYDDYAHLARVGEWAVDEESGDDP
ncbi:MAG: double-strand break repair protein AddB [Hyphomicrobiaceae bacterium]